jgi:hypothetical protein
LVFYDLVTMENHKKIRDDRDEGKNVHINLKKSVQKLSVGRVGGGRSGQPTLFPEVRILLCGR